MEDTRSRQQADVDAVTTRHCFEIDFLDGVLYMYLR